MTWKNPPSQFEKILKEEHAKKVSLVALSILKKLTMRTPVKTGRARANWLASVGSPRGGTVDPTFRNLAEAVQVFRAAGEFPTLYITNNLPYIRRLNEGWSKQAPANFVELSIQSVMDAL